MLVFNHFDFSAHLETVLPSVLVLFVLVYDIWHLPRSITFIRLGLALSSVFSLGLIHLGLLIATLFLGANEPRSFATLVARSLGRLIGSQVNLLVSCVWSILSLFLVAVFGANLFFLSSCLPFLQFVWLLVLTLLFEPEFLLFLGFSALPANLAWIGMAQLVLVCCFVDFLAVQVAEREKMKKLLKK